MKAGLKIHTILAVAGFAAIPAALLVAQSTHRSMCIGTAFALWSAAFALNGCLGVVHGKMHMQIGDVVSRQSRGEKMFRLDIAVQFAGAALSLGIASWFLLKALR